MNNSNLKLEKEDSRLSFLQDKQGELIQLIEAINRVEASEDWQKLKKLLLDEITVTLERQLSSEANKGEINPPNIYRLQGQLAWARKYADLKKLSETKRQQLENLKKQTYEKNPSDGAL